MDSNQQNENNDNNAQTDKVEEESPMIQQEPINQQEEQQDNIQKNIQLKQESISEETNIQIIQSEGAGIEQSQNQNSVENEITQSNKPSLTNETSALGLTNQNLPIQQENNQSDQQQENQPNQSQASQTHAFLENIDHLANIINQIDSQILLQRGPLESLINLLQIAQPSEFDDVSDPVSLIQLIELQYHKKKSDLETIIYHVMKGYDELNLKVNLNQLEKIMRILKSKNKSIYITKDDSQVTCQCLCQHHQNEQDKQQKQNEETNLISTETDHQGEQQQQEENQIQEQIPSEENNEAGTKQESEGQQLSQEVQEDLKNELKVERPSKSNDPEEPEQQQQLLLPQLQLEQPAIDLALEELLEKQKQEVEKFEQQIEQNKIALQEQEENVDQQLQQVEGQDQQQPMTQTELEENVEQLKDSISRSREQIEKLTEQRDALLEKSKELAEKQLELRIQQQQILHQLQQTEEEENKTISCNDIFGIMTLNNLNLNQLQNYNGQTNSLIFKLNKNYTVEIKSDDSDQPRVLGKESNLNVMPLIILNRHILPYLSALELFKLRGVCGWFKEQQISNTYHRVKQTWPIVFKREMFEQLLARDLMKNVYALQKLQILKSTLFFKVQTLIEAILHVVDWEQLTNVVNSKNIEIDIYRPLLGILTLFNKQQEITYSYQIDGTLDISELAKDLKSQVQFYLQAPFLPLTFTQMRKLNDNILSAPEFGIEFLRNNDDKLPLYLTILVQLLYFHGLIHQTFIFEEFQLKKWKQEQAILDQRQTYNQNFLEGAYKKLLLRNCQEDQEEESQQDETGTDTNEAAQFLRALTNLVPTENPEPDIVIRRNKTVTKIYIDINTKLDILVQTIEQYKVAKADVPQKEQTEEGQIVQQVEQSTQSENIQVNQEEDNNDQVISQADQVISQAESSIQTQKDQQASVEMPSGESQSTFPEDPQENA